MFNNQNFLQDPRCRHSNANFNMHFSMYQNAPTYGVNYNAQFIYPPPSHTGITSNDVSVIAVGRRQNDESNIEHFLQEIEQFNDINDQQHMSKASNIGFAKKSLVLVYNLNERIKSICAKLKKNPNLTEVEWQEKINSCQRLKEEISKLMEILKDPSFLSKLKKDIERRKKKRIREQRKRKKWQKEKTLHAEKRATLHAQADSWIRKEQAVIDREKQEENLRRDADMILSDVRGKRNDAKKYLSLLQELQNLRNIKISIARARGEHLSSAADEAFNNIIAKLTEQWSTLDREYSIEEQGLKLMLKTDNEKKFEKQKKNLFDDWENVLFGRKMLIPDQSPRDSRNIIIVRSAWDKYISCDSDASTIPIGWIVPDKPSSAAWQKCLKKDAS